MNRLMDDINGYVYRINNIKNSILALQGEELLDNHKKTLMFSLLDTISKGVYGDKYSLNGERFKSFILEFCNWDNAQRISLQQVALLIKKVGGTNQKQLEEYIFKALAKYPNSRPIPFDVDPTIEEVEPFLLSDTIYKKIKLDYFKHVNLLWRYRNSLVHEARSLGANHLFDYEVNPHYIHYFHLRRDRKGNTVREEYWEIYYPLNFFVYLVDNAIINMETYLIKNELNPFNHYEFEPLWIRVK